MAIFTQSEETRLEFTFSKWTQSEETRLEFIKKWRQSDETRLEFTLSNQNIYELFAIIKAR